MPHQTPAPAADAGLPSDQTPDPAMRLSDLRLEAQWKAKHVKTPGDLMCLAGDCYGVQSEAERASFPRAPAEAVRAAKAALTGRVDIELTEPAEAVEQAHTLLRALLVFAETAGPNSDDFVAGVWLLDTIAAPALRKIKEGNADCHARLRALAQELGRTEGG